MDSGVEIGQHVGHYRIVSLLGRGGMGEVWEAEDTKLKRRVALKILPPQVADDAERLARFQREAETVAALNHPNIVTLFSVENAALGGTDKTVHFLTMEHVEGRSLADSLPGRGLELDKFFDIALPLAAAVAGAHEKGVTHRDIKPANVMVGPNGQVKVLDFGLAKFDKETLDLDDTRQSTEWGTSSGAIMGTVTYMSPEQAEGKPVDERTDIFSLGVVLYEMATGARPFGGDTAVAVLSSILRDKPPSISAVQPQLPRQLGRIINQCLEKQPEARSQTARDVYNQLQALRTEIEIEDSGGRDPHGEQRADPLAGARSRHTWAIAVATAALIAFAWWVTTNDFPWFDPSVPSPTVPDGLVTIAVMPFENLGPAEREHFAAGMAEEIASRLMAVEGVGVPSRTTVSAYDRSGQTLAEAGAALGVDYILEGTVRSEGGADGNGVMRITPTLVRVADDRSIWSDIYERPLENTFAVQSDIAERVLDQIGITLQQAQAATTAVRGGTTNVEAYEAYSRGSDFFRRADELYDAEELQAAIDNFNRAITLDSEFALAYAKLSLAHNFSYQFYFDRSQERRDLTRAAADRALEIAPGLPEGILALGQFHRSGLDYDLALEQFVEAARRRPGDSLFVQAIAELSWYAGDTEPAIEAYERAYAIDPQRSSLYCNLGGVYRMDRNFDEALALHANAISIRPERSCPYYCVAFTKLHAEGPESARTYLESLDEGITRSSSPPIAYPWMLVDIMQGRYEDALARLDSDSTEALDWQHYYYPKSLLRGHIHRFMGDDEEARLRFTQASEMLQEKLRERPDDARLHSSLGIAYAGLGRNSEAVASGLEATRLVPHEIDKFSGAYRLKDMAQIYAMVGDTENTLDSLELLLSMKSLIHFPEITEDPTWAGLRGNPRFEALGSE